MKDDPHKSSIQSFDIEFSKNMMMTNANYNRLLKFEANFQRTSMIMLITFFAFSIYDTVDFCYSIYLVTYLCWPLAVLYIFDVISDLLFWAATIQLYVAIKSASMSRLKRFTYIMIAIIVTRLIYAVILLAIDEGIYQQNQDENCKLTRGEKAWKMILYLLENLIYVVSVGSVHYMISLLENIKEQPPKFIHPDLKDSLLY